MSRGICQTMGVSLITYRPPLPNFFLHGIRPADWAPLGCKVPREVGDGPTIALLLRGVWDGKAAVFAHFSVGLCAIRHFWLV